MTQDLIAFAGILLGTVWSIVWLFCAVYNYTMSNGTDDDIRFAKHMIIPLTVIVLLLVTYCCYNGMRIMLTFPAYLV